MDINKKRFGDLSRCALVKQGLLLWVVIYTLIRPRLGNQQCPFDVDFDKTLHHLVIASFLLITQESSSTCFFCGLLVSHPASCKLYGLLMSKTKHLYICFGLLLPAVFFPERPSQRLFFSPSVEFMSILLQSGLNPQATSNAGHTLAPCLFRWIENDWKSEN